MGDVNLASDYKFASADSIKMHDEVRAFIDDISNQVKSAMKSHTQHGSEVKDLMDIRKHDIKLDSKNLGSAKSNNDSYKNNASQEESILSFMGNATSKTKKSKTDSISNVEYRLKADSGFWGDMSDTLNASSESQDDNDVSVLSYIQDKDTTTRQNNGKYSLKSDFFAISK